MHSAPAAPRTSLTPQQRETLRAVLDLLVPASADGRMPAAGELPDVLRQVEDLQPAGLNDMLDALHGAGFAAVDATGRARLLDECAARDPVLLQRLRLEAVTCYYQQDAVVERLGLEPRPPHPKGYQVISGDLTLLKPVIARGRIYRDPP